MMQSQLHTPVLFLVFNRLDTTKQVFEAIRQAQPPKLFVAADGPRVDRNGEAEMCDKVREFILNNIDWECEIKTLFRDENLGCRVAVSSAIDWFFENVEEGIILEDDCLPHQDFFHFCQEMLEYYRDDERIMHIGGSNFQLGKKRGDASYYFSRYAHIWGWASWRRAWKHYDVDLNTLNEELLQKTFKKKKVANRWFEILLNVKNHKAGFNTWDFQWSYALFVQSGLAIIPKVNLVSNIGFFSGTHNLENQSEFSEMKTFTLNKKLVHQSNFSPNASADNYIFKKFYQNDFIDKLLNKCKRLFK